MNRLSFVALGLSLLATPVLAQSAPGSSTVSLTFDTGAQTGAVMVALYDSEASYESGRPVGSARIDVAAGQRTATFNDLPAGDYAAKAFHDVDGNGEMATNPFGMPTEPYAFSNNAVGNMGPARWDRANFAVEGDVAQTIVIR
ncbi:DUF2141 domain-containing protein [Brevundimonas sp. Root1279]|uniref:DUF2141 domain-containing protein n=1 Tax=Brevundimonas sp. Root1279 TaxID=1736443 RepID=UPI0006F5703A|nr:DUF2141 domain-containing protein [Brevundimonas sp. Root1279]KQW81911.1 hypothetical protein ASC65_11540 [Brevundimonas sp. Root1279]